MSLIAPPGELREARRMLAEVLPGFADASADPPHAPRDIHRTSARPSGEPMAVAAAGPTRREPAP